MKKHIVRFFVRMIVGLILVYGVNQILLWQKIDVVVGYNIYTVLTSGFLGFPGVVALFTIRFFSGM